MTTQEKAKAYDEALERARRIKNGEGDWRYSDLIEIGPALTEIFPQLCESEDERIRKELIEAFEVYDIESSWNLIPVKRILAWLEKQKELPTNEEMLRTLRTGYEKGVADTIAKYEQKEQKPVEYLDKDKIYAIMKKLHDLSFSQDILINSKEYKQINEITHDVRSLLDYPIEQKPAEWSEEDEKMLNSCISSIEEAKENRYAYKETDGDTSYDHEISWLKSLRPQPRWKPSEEQMDALAYAIQLLDDGLSPKAAKAGEELEHFREQLKKL